MPMEPISMYAITRRRFLGATGAGVLLAGRGASAAVERPKVAAVLTEFTYRSHAHVILENFLGPYLFNGQRTDPGMDVVSLYVDQFPNNDMARQVAKGRSIPIYATIAEALTLGGKGLA